MLSVTFDGLDEPATEVHSRIRSDWRSVQCVRSRWNRRRSRRSVCERFYEPLYGSVGLWGGLPGTFLANASALSAVILLILASTSRRIAPQERCPQSQENGIAAARDKRELR